jgi:P27 family predicted phage terminase small subunit
MDEPLPATLDRATEAAAAVYLRTLPRLLELGVTWRLEETIRQYCNAISLSEAAIEELDSSPVVIVSEKTGGKYLNPAISVLGAANKEARASGQALGLVPKTTDTLAKPAPALPQGGPSSFQKRG